MTSSIMSDRGSTMKRAKKAKNVWKTQPRDVGINAAGCTGAELNSWGVDAADPPTIYVRKNAFG